jgi:hypothetical protein
MFTSKPATILESATQGYGPKRIKNRGDHARRSFGGAVCARAALVPPASAAAEPAKKRRQSSQFI